MPYLNGLVAAWKSRYQSGTEPSPTSGLADPLSAREGAISTLLPKAAPTKNRTQPRLAPETVKSHVKHNLHKARAEKRAQAVARAQSLAL